MASVLGNYKVYPRWNVLVWRVNLNLSGGMEIALIDSFDAENEAKVLFDKISVDTSGKSGSVIGVNIRFDDGEDCYNIWQKDETGSWEV